MLRMSQKLQDRMLERRQNEWLDKEIATYTEQYPEAFEGLPPEEAGKKIEGLFAAAEEAGILHPANKERFAHIALHLNHDTFHQDTDWGKVIFGWDSDENLKLSACEKRLATLNEGAQA